MALAALSSPAWAQSLSLQQALAQALEHNPALRANDRELGMAQGERQQAGVIANPELSWSVEDTRSNSRITAVQVSQPIELGGKRGARVELAERGLDSAALQQEQARNNLRAQVVQAFHGALQAAMRLQLAEQTLTVSRRAVEVVEGQVQAGKISTLQAKRAQLQLDEVLIEQQRASSALLDAKRELQVSMGSAYDLQQLQLEGNVTSLPRLPLENDLLRRLPGATQMRLAEMQIQQQDASLAVQRSERIPNLTVSIGSQYSQVDRQRVNLLGLSMPLPLFDRNQGNVLAASYRADQARDLRNATEQRLRADVLQASSQWRVAQASIASFERQMLNNASAALDNTTRGFQLGKFGFIEVLDAQRSLIDIRTRYLQALADALDAWVRLARIYGDLSAG
ncbi:TolC family protein [Pseudomonas sp. 5P_3.1_Bac2]|nr:TolC family protein [Pseudomonas sp. 5P_3.1_Bac2]MCU1717369.1 TolC family protein [Pseudomonas sp. 5P_3.1_Bac2]